MGFLVIHPTLGRRYAQAPVPASFVALLDNIKLRDTYIGQFELLAAITPFLSLPREWFENQPVELYIDNSGAVGAIIKGYSGVPDCAKLVNAFHFAVAASGASSLWCDYVNTESNPADIPSRMDDAGWQEYFDLTDSEARDILGESTEMCIPPMADAHGTWLPFDLIARQLWQLA